jgi:hypothetical protein
MAARRPSSLSKVYVKVDTFRGADFGGSLYVFNGGKELKFDSLGVLLKRMEETFDRMSFPQKAFENRSFDKKAGKKSIVETRYSEMENVNGDPEQESKATFIIHVKYRQNATWQGEIKWVNRNRVQFFRSELEMIKLMDTALSEDFGREDKIDWE